MQPVLNVPVLNVDVLVDEQKFDRFNLSLLVWSFLAMFADGFEISSMGLAAPHIMREWGVAPGALGPVLTMSLVGILIGAPLFGYVGDRFGRRSAVILGCLVFGSTTLAVMAAENLTQVAVLRLLTGIGMGGLMPNAVSLNSELSPKRLRARLVILMFMGITLGSSGPGFASAWLVPEHGWKILFLLGGVVPLVIGAGLFFALPESVKFLATRRERRPELIRTLRRMRRDLVIPDDAVFVAPPPAPGGFGIAPVFARGLAAITPLLWLCFATTMLANYFLNSWMPILFEAKGIRPEDAALAATMYHFGALAGGLAMSWLLDRFGFLAIAVLLALGAPAMLAIGIEGSSPLVLAGLSAFLGFCILGAQFGTNAAAGLIYPTASRSVGVGLAFGVGRFGSVLGPILGAALIGRDMPLFLLLLTISGPILIGALAALLLARLSHRRFGGWKLDETPVEAAADV
jgi:AAHS family 4-hydroxybenzoate transporter-like MFS transporter